jgi:HD-GYP domain-containing protein (c-di-GMP phosphodiesterase class II)
MIQVTLEELSVGHTLARTIYRDTGEVLLSAGFHMTAEVRQKLADQGQNRFWVQEEGLETVISEELVSEQIVNQCAAKLRKSAIEFRMRLGLVATKPDAVIPTPTELFKSPEKIKAVLPIKAYKEVARNLYQEIRRVDQSILHMGGTRTAASYLFQHAVEAGIVAGILAKRYAFSENEVEDLILGTLLMDVGQLLLPDSLLMQTSRLTLADFNLLKEHPNFGFEMLRLDNSIPLVCAHVALQHQERQDGGGYPRKLVGNNQPPPLHQTGIQKNAIHRFAEIASVADEYLALIAPRPGIPAKTPIQSIKHLLRIAGSQLNMSIVNTLISMIPVYSSGCRIVVLEDQDATHVGCIGVVEKSNPHQQDRPDIILVYDREGKRIPALPIKLTESPSTQIREVLPGKSWDTAAREAEEEAKEAAQTGA